MPLLFAYGINRFSHDVAHIIQRGCKGCVQDAFTHPKVLDSLSQSHDGFDHYLFIDPFLRPAFFFQVFWTKFIPV